MSTPPHTTTDALGELETLANEFADFVNNLVRLSEFNEPQDAAAESLQRLRVDAPNVIAYLFEFLHGFVK